MIFAAVAAGWRTRVKIGPKLRTRDSATKKGGGPGPPASAGKEPPTDNGGVSGAKQILRVQNERLLGR